jgi:RNA polymerase sigma factor (sigma-70 family)
VRLGYLLTGNAAEAEDLAQEAFVRLLGRFADLRRPIGKGPSTLGGAVAFRTYLMRTVTNLARSRARHAEVERRHQPALAAPASIEPPDVEGRDELLAALAGLPHRQRAALVLRYCEDLSEQQTAEVLDTSVKAVKGLVTRGLAALRTEGVSR